MGYLKLPEGKRIAVNLGVDVDVQSYGWADLIDRRHPYVTRRVWCLLAYQGF